MTAVSPSSTEVGFAQRLREKTIAVRIHHEKLGVRKSLTKEQRESAAQPFHATAKSLNISKRLLNTRHPAFSRVSSIRRNATDYWKSVTVPYPEPGVRLLRRDRLESFVLQLQSYRNALTKRATELQEVYGELRNQAREDLGELFNPADYPTQIDDEFDLSWDFPSIEPPAYLKKIHPELYEQEASRIRARFEEAIAMTEQAFTSEFHKMVTHLADRLGGGEDGKLRTFHGSSVDNLKEFFEWLAIHPKYLRKFDGRVVQYFQLSKNANRAAREIGRAHV